MYRHIIHLHIPAFPIAVERVCRPDLRDRPVAMAQPHSERALVLSVSPEARREGIFKGMPLGKAMKFCPDLTVLPPNRDLTGKACHVLDKTVAHYTPLWEPFRPGHIYLDVTGTDRLWGKAKDTASRLRQEIKKYLRLSGMVGVAGNKMVSSIASRIVSSEGVLDVDHGQEFSFMAPLKASFLPGIGYVRKKILLEELNIFLVREIAALDMGTLRLVFGRQAYLIHQRALGIDPTPVYPPRMEPTVAEEITLSRDENDDQKLLGILWGLVEKCAHQLLNRDLVPHKTGLIVRYADQEEIIRRIKLPHVSFWDSDLYTPLEKIFLRACRRRVRVRFMKVWFQDFWPPTSQLSLFPAQSPLAEKKASVTQALHRIRERYGDVAIHYGRTAQSCLQDQGAQGSSQKTQGPRRTAQGKWCQVCLP
ncbi:MAG: DNA polymerase IV [Deltaproteobacteria bacterium]|nr:MAG: DNA polymerase IV [Deltaproteobacteria bacterium]UCH07471.1 MAG: DNA polymerase IV [Deltaproteobacteria bacterium]